MKKILAKSGAYDIGFKRYVQVISAWRSGHQRSNLKSENQAHFNCKVVKCLIAHGTCELNMTHDTDCHAIAVKYLLV